MQRIMSIGLFLLFMANAMVAQEVWGLQKCVNYALDNNIQIKQSRLTEDQTRLNLDQSKKDRYPNLTGNSSLQVSWGRNIDPITNVFQSQTVGYNSHSINTGALLYNGNNLTNTIKRNELSLMESMKRTKQMENDISLNVVVAYINAVFEQERRKNAQSQLAISKQQLERMEKLIEAGSAPEADRYDFQSQVARDEQNLVLSENNVQSTMLNLKQLLQLPPDLDMQLDRPDINIPEMDPDGYTFEQVYNAALQTQFNIQADQLSQDIAYLDIELARSQFYPSLSIGGSISTTFATIAKQIDGYTDALIPQDGVFINGEPVLFQVESAIPTGTSKIPYIDQLDQNLGAGFGVQLSIPIYNRGRTKTNVALAEINAKNQQLMNEQNKQTLKSNVQSAIADAQAAKRAYNAALLSMEAQEIAYQNTERKFEIGSGNSYELTEAKNRLDVALNDLLIAKYDLIFKLKVIDYYLGNPIKLN